MTVFGPHQTAIVTGGSQGLGLAIAEEMIGAGLANLVIVGRDRDKGNRAVEHLEKLGAEGFFVSADLSQPTAAEQVTGEASERFGPIHALVNAAAVTDRDSVWDATTDRFDQIFATNVRAPYFLTQGVARNMKDHGVEGSVVNIGSMAGHGGAPFITSYSASKSALIALTRNLANALAPHRIRVNIVNPGWMDTPAEDQIQRIHHGAGDGWLEAAGSRQPFGRLIDPSEVARLVSFVASPAAGLMTGAVIDFDQHVMGTAPDYEDDIPG